MPLPAALLNKLQKRGIVRQDGEPIEEVFAENYDDKEDQENDENQRVEHKADDFEVKMVYEVADCPNANNKYHECTQFCKETYGIKSFVHRIEDDQKRIKLLKKYPLPPGWSEVGDPLTGRCYYWNMETDKVSWLPPQHSRAKITVSAEKLQSNLNRTAKQDSAEGLKAERRKPVSVSIKEPGSKKKRYEKAATDELDPMDPASYSEVERGTWSTGLKNDAKSGVDSTASGPLFQQRPYPSPGDILRAQGSSAP